MTRKDYVRIARALREGFSCPHYLDSQQWMLEKVCAAPADDNPRFDRQRFIAAVEERTK